MKFILDNDIAGNARRVGHYFKEKLEYLKTRYSFVTEVRGCGLLLAMEFATDLGQAVLMSCLERGLLVNKVRPNAIRFIPPLIISNSEVDEAIDILDKVLSIVGR